MSRLNSVCRNELGVSPRSTDCAANAQIAHRRCFLSPGPVVRGDFCDAACERIAPGR